MERIIITIFVIILALILLIRIWRKLSGKAPLCNCPDADNCMYIKRKDNAACNTGSDCANCSKCPFSKENSNKE